MDKNDTVHFFNDADVNQTSEKLAGQLYQALKKDSPKSTFKGITEEMVTIQTCKNIDYGNSFYNTMEEFGPISAAIRMNDKLNRFKQLITTKTIKVQDEKIEDTLIDLANYAVMTVEWYRKKHESSKC